jgi:CO/xanthine dehydrogenase Mo-binding subunit
MKKKRSVRQSIPRGDAIAKVTGRSIFVTDFTRPGMIYGKLLLSDRAHARIVRIDTRKAQSLLGVEAIITGRDVPDIHYGLILKDRTILPKERVRFIGEPVAAVAAVSEKVANEAIRLIEIEYKDIKPVFSIESALLENAPILHPEVRSYKCTSPYIRYKNVCMDAKLTLGDITRGFTESDMIFEDTYRTLPMYQAYLEPHACLVEVDPDERITVWMGEQILGPIHEELATALDVPMSRVRVIPCTFGGGFGGKLTAHIEEICALLAIHSGKPVKLSLTRADDIFTTHSRAPYTTHLKTGVKKDGKIVAWQADILVDVGAYSDYAVGTAQTALCTSMGVYTFSNFYARARAIYTNNPDYGCMRGFGALEIGYALECHMDMIAHGLGLDPTELRYRNLASEGDVRATGQKLNDVSIKKLMDTAIEVSRYSEKKGKMGPNRGIGIANAIINTGMLSSSAIVRVLEDGSVNVQTGVIDIGTGTHTAFRQIVAEVFEIDVSRIHIASLDSDNSPYDVGSFASRSVFDSGNAIRMAAQDSRNQLIDIAVQILNCNKDDVIWDNGKAYRRTSRAEGLSMVDLVSFSLYSLDGPVIGRGSLLSKRPFSQAPGEGYFEYPFGQFLFATHVVEVEVDPETGKCSIMNYTACHDPGLVINPKGIEGQIEGGVVQGIGYALYEQLVVQNGRILNPSFVDYLIPSALDIPPIRIIVLEEKSSTGPFGAKGIGEPPTMPPMPAIANAILDAVGVQVKEIPITAEKLYWAIKQTKRKN